ncbi:hypothetical protein HOY80DRAFT_884662, partial [Tuber brumale]
GISALSGIPDFMQAGGPGLCSNLRSLNLQHRQDTLNRSFFDTNLPPFYTLAKFL